MNATPTTLSDVLWRWQRGMARAVLLAGAFAGMTFGTVAYAQIAFRNASSAAALQALAPPTASPGTTSSITFVGAGTVASAASGNVTPGLPTGWAADDIHILILETKDNVVSTVPAGWTLLNAANSGTTHRASLWWRRAVAGDTNPLVTHAAGNSIIARIIGFRGVDTTTAFDVANSFTVSAADLTTEAGAITTVTPNTMLVFVAMMADNHASIGLPSGSSPWTQAFFSATASGTDSSIAAHYGLRSAAGVQAPVTATRIGASSAISHGAQLALRPARTNLTITQPTGTVAGDVLVASIGFRPFCCDTPAANYTIAPVVDSGTPWTPLPRLDNAPGAGILPSNSLQVYWKVAGASEPAAYRWSFSVSGGATFDSAAGGILKFSGVDLSDTNTPIISGVEENGRQTTAGDQATPSITTTATNTMLVTSHSFASPSPWTTPPAGMTEVVDVQAGSQTTGIFYGVQSVVGPTGQKRAIPTPDDDIGNAHILALRSATPDTALTIPIPPGTVANDVMIAAITVRGADRSITPPSAPFDWVEVRRTEQTAGTANLQVFYVRAAGASEPADYTWTLAPGNTGNVGGILSFSGVDTTAPIVSNAIDNHGGNLSPGTGGAITATGITTNVANTVAVSAHSFVSTANWSAAAPAVEDVDLASRHVPRGDGISLAMYHYPLQATAGPTGDKTATASNDADTGIGQILALKPPPPAPAVGGFNAYDSSTAAGAITGVIKTRIAGSTISLDIIALNAAKTAIATGFTGTVRVEVLNSSDNTGALDANGCRPTWTVIQTLSPDPAFVAGDNGRKTVSFTQANSFPEARLRITFPAGAPTVTGCSNDNFAIRPNTFASFAVTDTDWQTAGTTRALNDVTFGAVTHKAGRPLSVRATALNAAGTPATTTNYVGAPTATPTACVGAACTATFGALTLTTTFVAGQLTSDVASYNNVGSFALQLVDSTFASVDAADTTGDCSGTGRYVCSATINVGRFVPDHFAVTLNTPTFGTACSAGGFTYMGQTFNYTVQPVITVTAQDFANGTTTLYNGAWLRITNSTVTPGTQAARYSRFDALGGGTTPALDPAGLPATTGDPTIGTFTSGVGTLTFGSGTGLAFTRSTTTPNAPFNADIALALNVIDTDAVAFAGNPAAFGTASAGGGIAFSSGKPMRFGRLVIRNANGSQLVPLPVPVEAQYFVSASSNFVTNAADNCTTLATNNEAMSNFTNNLAACETAITAVSAFSSGRSTLTLAAPGSGNNGSVDLTVNLSAAPSGTTCTTVGGATVPATGANRTYLQGNWTGGAYNVNPSARATFGVFKGAEEVIFQRENF